jgi:antirestriction protein ArdC
MRRAQQKNIRRRPRPLARLTRLTRRGNLRLGRVAQQLMRFCKMAGVDLGFGLGDELARDEDVAAYVGTWLKVLKDDKRAIFAAAAHAQRAAEYLHGLQPQPIRPAVSADPSPQTKEI